MGFKGVCDSGDEDGCDDGTTYAMEIYYNGVLVFWCLSWLWAAWCVLQKDYSGTKEAILVYFVLPFLVAPVCAALWPVLSSWWLLCRAPCHIFKGVAYARARGQARRRQAAIRYLSRFPPESKQRWRSRGWLVMLQSRHQTHLAEQQQQDSQKSRAWRCRWKTRYPRRITRVKIYDPLADIEQCEEGKSNQEFARAVVSVIDIMEEGVFRDIVSYL